MMWSSNNLLTLIVHRVTNCLLFEISTELVNIKIKIKIKKGDGFCKRLDVKFKLLCCCCVVAGGVSIINGAVADDVNMTKLI